MNGGFYNVDSLYEKQQAGNIGLGGAFYHPCNYNTLCLICKDKIGNAKLRFYKRVGKN